MPLTLLLIVAAASAFPSGQQTASTPQLLRVVIRSFIPDEHPRNPGYARSIPGVLGLFVIQSPESGCFATDGRGFSTGLRVRSRATTEFVLVIEGASVKLATAANRDMFRVEPLRAVDCDTATDIRPPSTPSAEPMTIDTLASYDGTAQVVFSASVSNPFSLTPVSGRMRSDAALRYGGSLILDNKAGTLGFKGFVSVFPAFEGFVEDERGVHPLFQRSPEPGSTVWSLYDPQPPVTTRPVEVAIPLR
jgi:hypothetical protein